MTENQYDKMMAECHQMGIGSSEWVSQKIAHSSKKDQLLENITFMLKSLRRVLAVSTKDAAGSNLALLRECLGVSTELLTASVHNYSA